MRKSGLMAALFGFALASPAQAQLMLPGAMPAAPTGSAQMPPTARKREGGGPAMSNVLVRPPGEEALAGQQLQRNGSSGIMALQKGAGGLEISKLALIGYQMASPTEICRIEISGPIGLRPAARHDGLISFDADVSACPFALDVLEGAARVRGQTCEMAAAGCRIDPTGVWGPPATTIGSEQSKAIEKARSTAESEARAGFRALLARAGKDRGRVKDIAREQAAFSSTREEICRDYAREDQHGFCASRVTMARAVALSVELHPDSATAAAKPVVRKKPRPRPAAAPSPDGIPAFQELR